LKLKDGVVLPEGVNNYGMKLITLPPDTKYSMSLDVEDYV